jgi:hypothetical protein
MSQDTTIRATRVLTDHGTTVSRDAPLSVFDDSDTVARLLNDVLMELKQIRFVLSEGFRISVGPEDVS